MYISLQGSLHVHSLVAAETIQSMEHIGPFSMGAEAEPVNFTKSIEPAAGASTGQVDHEQAAEIEGYDPTSFSKEMEKLEEMTKTLEEVKQKFNESSMKSLLLNADIVTMFDPVLSEELKSIVMSCTQCADKIAKMQSETIEARNTPGNRGCNVLSSGATEQSSEPQELMEVQQSNVNSCSVDPPMHED